MKWSPLVKTDKLLGQGKLLGPLLAMAQGVKQTWPEPCPRWKESYGKKLGLLKSLGKLVRILLCEQEGFLKGVCNCLVHPSLKGSTGTLPGCEQGDFSLLYVSSAVIFTLRSRTQALASFIY